MLYFLKELPTTAYGQAGGKGSTLARLSQSRYPIPDGFVILVSAFAGDTLKPEAWMQAQQFLTRMRQHTPGITFAVRSSALDEDAAQASFAGEFESILDVQSDEAIHDAIDAVRRSSQAERVKAYSQARALEDAHQVAVIVQAFVRADHAGVLFTADPITGNLMQMTGNAVRGAGERLVSGQANAQAFTFSRANGKYAGPTELRPYARRLYRLGQRLDQDLGAPQDIEWVIAAGKVSVVQARPITSLRGFNPLTGEWNDTLLGDFLWSNGNAAEIQPGVMPLLTATVGQLWGQGYSEWWSDRYRASGYIGLRNYFNITVQVAPFAKLPWIRADRLLQYVAQWWGRIPAGVELPLMPYSFRQILTSVVPMYLRSFRRFARYRTLIPGFVARSPQWCQDMRQRIPGIMDGLALAALWQDEIKPFYLLGTAMASAANTDIRAKIEAQLRSLVGEEDANALVSNLGGEAFIASLGPVVSLRKVARGEMSREAYLAQYGHRGPNEFNLIYPQPIENPAWLDKQLEDLAKYPVDVEALLDRQRVNFAAAWERLVARYPGKARSIRQNLDKAAQLAYQREAARSEITRVMGIIRGWALRAAELSGLGEGIFHLTLDEVLAVLAGDRTACRYIPARRETYERYCALPAYPTVISGRFDPFAWAADPDRRSDVYDAHGSSVRMASGSKVISGVAGSAGIVEGRVRRIDDPDDGSLLQMGEVLVTRTTNVGWTPLFPRAAAIVTDVGAALSHAAIVARELGVPAVVGCTDATDRLTTGDYVRVNGLRGTVEILEQAGR